MDFLQSFCLSVGKYACYIMCIIDIAEEYLNTKFLIGEKFEFIIQAIQKGYVKFDFKNYDNPDNFFVKEPAKILEMITGVKWTCEFKKTDYIISKQDYVVELWSTNGQTGHFARINRGYNSLQNSNCVNKGRIISYRIFRTNGVKK